MKNTVIYLAWLNTLPVFRLLLEYEEHLRNTLEKGLDAESYSLHTFQALMSQSVENIGNFYISFYIKVILLE